MYSLDIDTLLRFLYNRHFKGTLWANLPPDFAGNKQPCVVGIEVRDKQVVSCSIYYRANGQLLLQGGEAFQRVQHITLQWEVVESVNEHLYQPQVPPAQLSNPAFAPTNGQTNPPLMGQPLMNTNPGNPHIGQGSIPPMMPGNSNPYMMNQAPVPPMMPGNSNPYMMNQPQVPPMMPGNSNPYMMNQPQVPPMMPGNSNPYMMNQAPVPPMMPGNSNPYMMNQAPVPPMMPGNSNPYMMNQAPVPPMMNQNAQPAMQSTPPPQAWPDMYHNTDYRLPPTNYPTQIIPPKVSSGGLNGVNLAALVPKRVRQISGTHMQEWPRPTRSIYTLVNGVNTIEQIAQLLSLPVEQVYEMLFYLQTMQFITME